MSDWQTKFEKLKWVSHAFSETSCTLKPVDKGTVILLVKKFPAFYGACWFIILFVRTRQSTLSWTRPPRTLIVLWSTLVLSSNVLQDISRSLDLLDFQIKITYASYVLKLPQFTRSQIWATDTLQCHKENMVFNILEQHRQSGLESSIRLGKGNWFTSE